MSSCILLGIGGAFVCVMHSLRQQCLPQEILKGQRPSMFTIQNIEKSTYKIFCLPQEFASSMSLPSLCLSSLSLRSRRYLPASLGSLSVSSFSPSPSHPCPGSPVCSPGLKVTFSLEELDVSQETLFSDHARPPGHNALLTSSLCSAAAA